MRITKTHLPQLSKKESGRLKIEYPNSYMSLNKHLFIFLEYNMRELITLLKGSSKRIIIQQKPFTPIQNFWVSVEPLGSRRTRLTSLKATLINTQL
jgi:hypothetical protein